MRHGIPHRGRAAKPLWIGVFFLVQETYGRSEGLGKERGRGSYNIRKRQLVDRSVKRLEAVIVVNLVRFPFPEKSVFVERTPARVKELYVAIAARGAGPAPAPG